MFASKIKSQYIKLRKSRFCQGDILRDIYISFGSDLGESDKKQLERHYLPYCIIMTQDCDLNSDHVERIKNRGHDKYLQAILLCPAYQEDLFFAGTHIENWQMQQMSSKLKDRIKENNYFERYHHIEGDHTSAIPNLVIDFKHFFTVPRDLIYKDRKKIYLITLNELFRERLSQRFANYLSRFGLPDLKIRTDNQALSVPQDSP